MKSTDLLIVAAAAAVTYFVAGWLKKQKTTTTNPTAGAGPATEIKVDGDTNGWTYYSDGTAIDPWGAYYYQGKKVYDPFSGDLRNY